MCLRCQHRVPSGAQMWQGQNATVDQRHEHQAKAKALADAAGDDPAPVRIVMRHVEKRQRGQAEHTETYQRARLDIAHLGPTIIMATTTGAPALPAARRVNDGIAITFLQICGEAMRHGLYTRVTPIPP